MWRRHVNKPSFTVITSNTECICNYEKSDSIVTFDWFLVKIYFYPSKGMNSIKTRRGRRVTMNNCYSPIWTRTMSV